MLDLSRIKSKDVDRICRRGTLALQDMKDVSNLYYAGKEIDVVEFSPEIAKITFGVALYPYDIDLTYA